MKLYCMTITRSDRARYRIWGRSKANLHVQATDYLSRVAQAEPGIEWAWKALQPRPIEVPTDVPGLVAWLNIHCQEGGQTAMSGAKPRHYAVIAADRRDEDRIGPFASYEAAARWGSVHFRGESYGVEELVAPEDWAIAGEPVNPQPPDAIVLMVKAGPDSEMRLVGTLAGIEDALRFGREHLSRVYHTPMRITWPADWLEEDRDDG